MIFTIKRLAGIGFLALLLLILSGPEPGSAQGPVTTGPFIMPRVKGVPFKGDLRKLPHTQVPSPSFPKELKSSPTSARSSQPVAPFRDSVQQAALATLTMPGPVKSFDGLDDVNWGARLQPDSNGDVGPNHFVQGINMALGVYDKNGNALAATTLNDWWYQPAQT
ncbi:MAG: hypothetical protein ACM3S0_11830, partial [Acidobacteriota bacterium]